MSLNSIGYDNALNNLIHCPRGDAINNGALVGQVCTDKKGTEHSLKALADSECDSIHSDYSELAAPLRNIDIFSNQLDQFAHSKSSSPLDFGVETLEERAKREKKINLLSLAQEFANLKKIDSSALPFDLHKQTHEIYSPESESDSLNEDLCSNVESVKSSRTLSMLSNCANNQTGICDISANNNTGVTSQSCTVNMSRVISMPISNSENSNETSASVNSRNSSEIYGNDSEILPRNLQENVDLRLRHNLNGSNVTKDSSVKPPPLLDGPNQLNNNLSYSHNDNNNINMLANKTAMSDMPKNFAKISKNTLPPKNYDAVLSGHDFDIYNIESTLPEMDWSSLESRLTKAAEEDKQIKNERENDREQIRRKLAMGADEDLPNNRLHGSRRSSFQSRFNAGASLQICFMNDCDDLPPVYTESPPLEHDVPPQSQSYGSNFSYFNHQTDAKYSFSKNQNNVGFTQPVNGTNQPVIGSGQPVLGSKQPVTQPQDLLQQQAYLQAEAKMALAQASTMARMQLEIDKQSRRRVSLADKVGISYACVGNEGKLTLRILQLMNLAQIQVIVNDLHSQIEALNDELVQLLIERDDLHMEQDSMLVDVEDLTRRAKELSDRLKKTGKYKSKK